MYVFSGIGCQNFGTFAPFLNKEVVHLSCYYFKNNSSIICTENPGSEGFEPVADGVSNEATP